MTNRARMNFSVRFITRRQNMPVPQNVQAELQNMTRGDKTVKRPVRLGDVREAYRKCSPIAVTSHTLASRDRSDR